jgi:hypothetical protein
MVALMTKDYILFVLKNTTPISEEAPRNSIFNYDSGTLTKTFLPMSMCLLLAVEAHRLYHCSQVHIVYKGNSSFTFCDKIVFRFYTTLFIACL